MPWRDEPIQPMTLGNMRQNGVRGLFVTCPNCGHQIVVNADAHPDDVPVPSFGPRMRCTRCGKLGATAIPNWKEKADYLPGGARYRAQGPSVAAVEGANFSKKSDSYGQRPLQVRALLPHFYTHGKFVYPA
jgi:predicted RNA-binding Zn-ribbon protein involved in translation (DUF1610 family)